jgi:predicted tellurium resistance membrane protein TerC
MMEYLIALVALTAMEIVLGIDNIVFIAVLVGRLPEAQRDKARRLGLTLALGTRILLLLTISWILTLSQPLFALSQLGLPDDWLPDVVDEVSTKDLILLAGGLFLIWKSVHEIHHKLEAPEEHRAVARAVSFTGVLAQIAAVGMVRSDQPEHRHIGLSVMITAIVLAVIVMLIFSGKVSAFVERHPTLKVLALAFLILIGVMLVAEGVGTHLDKKYIYFAMAFSLAVEMLNLRLPARKSSLSPPAET